MYNLLYLNRKYHNLFKKKNIFYAVVSVPDSDEKDISLIQGIYRLDVTPIATLIIIERRL